MGVRYYNFGEGDSLVWLGGAGANISPIPVINFGLTLQVQMKPKEAQPGREATHQILAQSTKGPAQGIKHLMLDGS